MKVQLQVSVLRVSFLFQAVDKDVEDELTYEIVADSMNVTDSSLQNLMKKKPFKITDDKLQLAVDVEDDSLRGIFKFDVQVMDLGQLLQYWSLVRT